jgi:hypothetical protein
MHQVTCADEGSEEEYERKLVSRAAPARRFVIMHALLIAT